MVSVVNAQQASGASQERVNVEIAVRCRGKSGFGVRMAPPDLPVYTKSRMKNPAREGFFDRLRPPRGIATR